MMFSSFLETSHRFFVMCIISESYQFTLRVSYSTVNVSKYGGVNMNIFIVGASGRVATKLIKNLIEEGHYVVAGSRHPKNIIEMDGVKSVNLDLHDSIDEIANIIGQPDVIYFTAGSRGHDLLQTDAFGAVKVMKAAEKNQINRFIMLSSLFSLEPDKWYLEGLRELTDYNIAKFFADNYLINDTSLCYTILQPGALTETKGTMKITIDDGIAGSNSIDNVAQTLSYLLDNEKTFYKVITMRDGDMDIEQALNNIN